LTELESRLSSRDLSPERFQELHATLRGEVEALSGRFAAEMRDLAEQQQSQTAPLQQGLQQLETKLATLREELPPKIRQIVEAVEGSMDARMSAADQQTAGLVQALAALRAETANVSSFQQTVDHSLRSHAEHVGALDRKLTGWQDEVPLRIKASVDAVRESLEARLAAELHGIEERHSAQIQQSAAHFSAAQEQFRQQLEAESKTPALEQSLAQVQAELAGVDARLQSSGRQTADHLAGLEQHAAQISAGMAAELESLRTQHRTEIEQLEARWRAERAAENVPAQIDSAVAGLRQSLEAKLATEIHDLAARTPDRSADLEKALQYASLLEGRVQALEQKLPASLDETVDRTVERVWQALDSRLRQRQAEAPIETIRGLRQKSTIAEQSVLDLIAGLGQLFEKPVLRVEHEAPPRVSPPVEPVPPVHVEPERAVAAPTPPAPEAEPKPEPAPPVHQEPLAAKEAAEPASEDKPPVILFKPKDSGRKWRIPFVSSFLMMALAIAWLQFR